MTIQSFASTRFISFIRVYILIATKQVAKAVNTTLIIKPTAPRGDINMPSLSRLKIASRRYNRLIVTRSCGFRKNEGMATSQREDCPGNSLTIRSIVDLDLNNDRYRAQKSDKRTNSPLRSEKSERISPQYNPKRINLMCSVAINNPCSPRNQTGEERIHYPFLRDRQYRVPKRSGIFFLLTPRISGLMLLTRDRIPV